jgi:hypothetical protein
MPIQLGQDTSPEEHIFVLELKVNSPAEAKNGLEQVKEQLDTALLVRLNYTSENVARSLRQDIRGLEKMPYRPDRNDEERDPAYEEARAALLKELHYQHLLLYLPSGEMHLPHWEFVWLDMTILDADDTELPK